MVEKEYICKKEDIITRLSINYARMEERFKNVEDSLEKIEHSISRLFKKLEASEEKFNARYCPKYIEPIVMIAMTGLIGGVLAKLLNLI